MKKVTCRSTKNIIKMLTNATYSASARKLPNLKIKSSKAKR